MAGEKLLKAIHSRGGNDSDYADIVFGTVVSTSPLKIQISNQMTLTDAFLVLGRYVTKHKEKKVTYKDWKSDGEVTRKDEEVIVDDSLENGDGVAMIRMDGGQQYYVFEKTAEEGDVDG